MSRIIDEFKAKSGFLASWRYKRVLIDDDGIITNTGVPGKETLNLPCLSDYNRNNRRYAQNDIITEFCNLTTYTHYTVRAQDCEPFAFVQTVLNDPQCGYMEPLPTPAVPPDPFGEPDYNLYKFFEFCNYEGTQVVVNIYSKCFDGTATEIMQGGDDPVIIRYLESNDNKNSQIREVEAEITFMAEENAQYSDFYSFDERTYRVEILTDSILTFVGFITPDSCQEPFIAPGYPVSIRAVSGLGGLQKVSYPLPEGTDIDTTQRFIDILAFCFSQTGLKLNMATVDNMYERQMLTGLNDDPFAQSSVSPLRLFKGGSVMTCYEVLTFLCNEKTAFITQVGGAWHFVRTNELGAEIIRKRTYNSTALFLFAENVDNRILAPQEADTLSGALTRIGNAYKRAVAQLHYGEVPSLVNNGNFEVWDGQNFQGWTRFGGFGVTQIQKVIPGAGGVLIDIDDHAALITNRASTSSYLQADPIIVRPGDKIRFSIDVGTAENSYYLKMRIKAGVYYLYNPPGTNDFEWLQQLSSVSIVVENGNFDVNYRTLEFDMPAIKGAGDMFIQIYGFEAIPQFDRSGNVIPPPAYIPIPIDNVGLEKTPEQTAIDGVLYVSQQSGYFTEEPEITDLIFGDYTGLEKPRPARVPQVAGTNLLYAIYTADGSFSTGWKQYGTTGEYLPIGQQAALNILKGSQYPFRFYEGGFYSFTMNYLTAVSIIVPGDFVFSSYTFIQLSTEYNLKTGTVNGTWVQLFERYNTVIENGQLPHRVGTNPPPFVQNPNDQCPLNGDGIFTPQFDDTFV